MSTVVDAFKSARTILGDDVGLKWTDAILFPKIVQAYNEMSSKLILNGFQTLKSETSDVTITTGATGMGVDLPANLVKPIKMDERGVGEPVENTIPMTKCDFIPDIQQSQTLRYWCYRENLIIFLGATQDRIVHLYYEGSLTPPTKVTDTLQVSLSETFLGPRAAAIAVMNTDKSLYEMANQIAEDNLGKLVRIAVKGDQSLPVRRRPFSYSMRTRRTIY